MEMTKNTLRLKQLEGEGGGDYEDFNRQEITVDSANSYHRIFECD
jgi:hypothetical protein